MRNIAESLDKMADDIKDAVTSLEVIDKTLPQIITQLQLTADDSEALANLLVSTYGQSSLQTTQTNQTFDDQINVGLDFDQSRSDDYFYIPHEAFDNEDLKTGMQLLMSPDGQAARLIVTHEGDANGPEGVQHVDVRLHLPAARAGLGGVGGGRTRAGHDEQRAQPEEGAQGEEASYNSAGHGRRISAPGRPGAGGAANRSLDERVQGLAR